MAKLRKCSSDDFRRPVHYEYFNYINLGTAKSNAPSRMIQPQMILFSSKSSSY